MSKPKHPRMLAPNEAQAVVSNIRVSPRKLNLVAGLIRNQPASRAVATLTFSKRRIAHQVRKALESAIANAENNHSLDVDQLVVTRAEVGRSIVMRRFHARGRGRASRIEKWFSHLKIVVTELDPEALEAARARAAEFKDPDSVLPADIDAELEPETAAPEIGAETGPTDHAPAETA